MRFSAWAIPSNADVHKFDSGAPAAEMVWWPADDASHLAVVQSDALSAGSGSLDPSFSGISQVVCSLVDRDC